MAMTQPLQAPPLGALGGFGPSIVNPSPKKWIDATGNYDWYRRCA